MTIGPFKDKKILVTGGTGSIGSEIVRSLNKFFPDVIRVFSNDENAMFHLQNEIERKNHRYIIGDICDKETVSRAMEDIDIVFHAAALKHVHLCEYNTWEAVKTNIFGTENVIEAAFQNNVKKVINISTDKAVNPINTMGATKLLTEKLIRNANERKGSKKTVFSSVRFGNVMMSRGSVMPLWEEQIQQGKPVTITDPDMTRYMMSIDDAVRLVFKAVEIMQGGEVFILKMPVVRLGDLADKVIAGRQIPRSIIGLRPGEKKHEELMTEQEKTVVVETDDMFIVPFWMGVL
jgi:FlaA1/EpsC-like NDP-sugar epimerase